VLDVDVEVEFERRVCAGRQRRERRRLPVVRVRDSDRGSYLFYLTNMASEGLGAKAVSRIHACRWQVELVFKELKSHYRLHEAVDPNASGVLLLQRVVRALVRAW
jgi:IS4 transposase